MEALVQELSMHKRASDFARRLAPLTSGAFKRGNPLPFKRPFSGGSPSAIRFDLLSIHTSTYLFFAIP